MSILRRLSRFLGTEGEMTNINPGNVAPDFSLKGLDGKQYSLEALTQKGPVVAAFFKISCPVCQFTFPFLERIHKRDGGEGATFLGISQDDAKATKSFASEYGVTFPMAPLESPAWVSTRKAWRPSPRSSPRAAKSLPPPYSCRTNLFPLSNLAEAQKTRSGPDLWSAAARCRLYGCKQIVGVSR